MLWLPEKGSLPNHLHSTYSSFYLSLSSTFSGKPANNCPAPVSWVTSKIALNGAYFRYSGLLCITHSVQGWPVWPSEGRRSDGMCHLQGEDYKALPPPSWPHCLPLAWSALGGACSYVVNCPEQKPLAQSHVSGLQSTSFSPSQVFRWLQPHPRA